MVHILVVEDNPAILEHTSDFIRNFTGLDLMTATSGNSAVKILKENRFNLIVSDYQMADGNGDVIVEYLEEAKLPIPIIFHTASLDLELVTQTCMDIRIVNKYDFKDLGQAIMYSLTMSLPRKIEPKLPE